MRLSKLKGLREEDEQIPSDIPSNDEMDMEKKLKYASEKFAQTLKRYSKQHLFWKKVQIPEGELHITVHTELIPYTYVRYSSEKFLGDIIMKIDFIPNMEPNPTIPLNILQVSVTNFIDSLLEINPDLLQKPSVYPHDLLNCYHFKIQNISVWPGNGILHMRDYMDTPTYNLRVLSPQTFGSIMFSRSHMLNVYSLIQGDLPTFADGYSLAMDKIVTKAKHVFHALKKGTWKGHTYELEPPSSWRSGIVLHQDKFDYNKTDKVLHPNFSASFNLGWEYVDGVKNNDQETVLQPDERTEFRKWLKKRFEHFGLNY